MLRLGILCVMGSLLFCAPSEEYEPGPPYGYLFGEETFPDEEEVVDAINFHMREFEYVTGDQYQGPWPKVTFVKGVECTNNEGHTYPNAINYIPNRTCYAGLLFTCTHMYVVLRDKQALNLSALKHELFHCYLQETTGNANGAHDNPLWKEVGL